MALGNGAIFQDSQLLLEGEGSNCYLQSEWSSHDLVGESLGTKGNPGKEGDLGAVSEIFQG